MPKDIQQLCLLIVIKYARREIGLSLSFGAEGLGDTEPITLHRLEYSGSLSFSYTGV